MIKFYEKEDFLNLLHNDDFTDILPGYRQHFNEGKHIAFSLVNTGGDENIDITNDGDTKIEIIENLDNYI